MKPANRLNSVQEYYFSHKLREVRSLIDDGRPIVNLGIGNPDLRPPSSVIKAMQQSLKSPGIHGYQSYKGLPELRESIAGFYHKFYEVSLDADSEVLPLMGSKEGIMHISMAFLNPGDQVLVPNPGYLSYSSVSKLVGAESIHYDLTPDNNFHPDFKELEKLDLSGVKLMWVNYPHNPTGAKANHALYEKLIAFGKKHHILIVNDNPYSFILSDEPLSILSIPGAKDIAVELNSLSKSFNIAGWRVGMACGSKQNIEYILKVKSNMDSGMFYGIQQGAIAALGMERNWFDDMNEIYKNRRDLIWQIANKLNYTYDRDAAGFFVWAKLPKGIKSKDATEYLLHEKNIFVAPGSIFGSNGEGFMRFSLCVDEIKLQEVLNRI